MNKRTQAAFDELVAMGVPVVQHDHLGGHFQLSGEEDSSIYWVDYYNPELGDFGISDKIHAVLDKYDLYAEWENAAIALVYDT